MGKACDKINLDRILVNQSFCNKLKNGAIMQKSKDLQKMHSAYNSLLSNLKKHNIEGAEKAIESIETMETEFWY